MNALRLTLSFLLAWVIFIGCEEKKRPQTPSQPSYTRVAPTASKQALATQENIVKVEAKKQIELERISAQTRLKQLELEKEKELALLRERERIMRIEHEQAKERYAIWAGIALMILAGLALLWYFDRRRQDKLIAYKDNLHKYFLFKENETRLKIAEKIIDTVARQEISPEEKAKLIEVLHSPVAEGKAQIPREPENGSEAIGEDPSHSDSVIDVQELGEEEERVTKPRRKKRPWYRFW